MAGMKCPVEGCVTEIDGRLPMCKWHWNYIPRDLAQRLLAGDQKPSDQLRLHAIAIANERR
jgi:hypothetical protein